MSERAVDYRAEDIARLVPDGATVALTGAGIFLEPDEILAAIEKSFLQTGHPRDLTVVHALGIGDGKASGMSRFAHDGMTRRVIGGHWSWSPAMQAMARDNRVEAYSFPAGVISSLLREIGAGRPGLTTRIGLGTFADPAVDGCHDPRIGSPGEGVEAPRLHLRRPNDRLRLHAGHGPRQRSYRRLLYPRRGRGSAPELHSTGLKFAFPLARNMLLAAFRSMG